ncbi:CLUMA_CG020885, isoform A [Clunio marinus]|uniref:CLUMA_CG020885, isoform A n=1 Tax=Clunio marinus TaxID=568069 RepID=A0A1J1JB27_9DIPT|nr:CLUMA_CG020885, isoform A [Clunio marinus]
MKHISECLVRKLEIKQENDTVTGISGTLSEVIDYDRISKFKVISSPDFKYFPMGIEKFFPNLEEIIISNTGLKTLPTEALRNFHKLRKIHVTYSQLQELEQNVFFFNGDIEEVNLSENNLTRIGVNAFKHLHKLKKLNLMNNFCINETANHSLYVSTCLAKVYAAIKSTKIVLIKS